MHMGMAEVCTAMHAKCEGKVMRAAGRESGQRVAILCSLLA
jgi:hypothetical protein